MTPPTPTPNFDRDATLENLIMYAELGQDERVRDGIHSLHPADIAELLDVIEEAETKTRVFSFLPPALGSEVLSFVAPSTRSVLAQDLSDVALGSVIEHLESDDAADLLESLSPHRASAILSQVPRDLAAEMAQLLRHPADVAGLIMVDDVVDVLEEEATEDIYKLANLSQEEEVFGSPWRSIRYRLPWLGLNLVTATLSASVITLFEDTIQALAVAAAFMTIVAAQGGNAGIQTLTVIVRGLALGEVNLNHAKRVLLKELSVALGNGLILGCIAGAMAYMWQGSPLLGGGVGSGAPCQPDCGRVCGQYSPVYSGETGDRSSGSVQCLCHSMY